MAQEQRVITPLVESSIRVEPATPSSMGINTRIQRAWSMLFGRRENTLQPVYASRGGMLGVVNRDLNGWTLVYSGVTNGAWTDFGSIVDLVYWGGIATILEVGYAKVGMETGVVTHQFMSDYFANATYSGAPTHMCGGVIQVRCRWIQLINASGVDDRVIAYTAPPR